MPATAHRELIARARSLFEFLREAQRLRSTNLTAVEQYEREGFARDIRALLEPSDGFLLEAPALQGDWDLSKPLVIVPRLSPSEPPAPPRAVLPFVDGDPHDPRVDLAIARELRDAADEGTSSLELQRVLAGATAEQMLHAAETYVTEWEDWAADEKLANGVRRRYQELFRAKEDATTDAQTWEFLLGIGRIRVPARGDTPLVDRPLLTVPLTAAASRGDGALKVTIPADARFRLELDMLPPDALVSAEAREELENIVCAPVGQDLELPVLEGAVQVFVNTGLRDARFVSDEDFFTETGAVVATRPLVVKRRRSAIETVMALDAVVRHLQAATTLPPGLAAIVDPLFAAEVPDEDVVAPNGGVISRDGQHFTPLPVNERQWSVIKRADTRPLTLVQGPPGTGKTHVTAALISHLLAQGKRILVTAHNPEALSEVRDKLPDDIKTLAVSVIGAGQAESAHLRSAIDSISRRGADFDRERNEDDIRSVQHEIEQLLSDRDGHLQRLIHSRREESEAHSTPFGSQTLAELADEWRNGLPSFAWGRDFFPDPATAPVELGLAEIPQLQEALREFDDSRRVADAAAIRGAVGDAPLPDQVDALVDDYDRLVEAQERHEQQADRHYVRQLAEAEDHVVESARDRVQDVLDVLDSLRSRPESWVVPALRDITAGRNRAWNKRLEDVDTRLVQAHESLSALRPHEPMIMSGDPGRMRRSLGILLGWLDADGEIRLDGAGRPKTKMLAPKPVKEAWHLWDDFTVRGRPAVDRAALDALATHFLLQDQLAGLDASWPAGTSVSREQTGAERIAWHEDEADVLREVLDVPTRFQAAEASVGALPGHFPIRWLERESVVSLIESLSALLTARRLARVTHRIDGYVARVEQFGNSSVVGPVAAALNANDKDGYRARHAALAAEIEFRDRWRTSRQRLNGVRQRLPRIAELLPVGESSEWLARFQVLEQAWHWTRLDAWLRDQASLDPNRIQAQISGVDGALRDRIGRLAALRAWGRAVDRLTPDRRADLQAYVTLIKRLGKGTGKNAPRIRAQIQPVLARCRGSVPVWIMPLYRVFESQEMKPDSFDVVIIDEASQATLDALVLLFLAPKVVVVGDDRQVSPSAVGVNQDPFTQLVESLLRWSPQMAVYQDPARSLFDEARMRFPDLITLTEHRRCVPAIIGFSDQIAYRPDVELEPVRETGAHALPPLATSFVEGAVIERRSKTNRAEQDAIVAEIRRCVDDPAYAGKTFGVISLLGSKQAQRIEERLTEILSPEEFDSRRVRCGEPPNFQGAERDVIFLSLVVAPNEKYMALAKLENIQRFNVAVSRARDRVHLFHSVKLDALANAEDMRRQLLEYMLTHAEASTQDMEPSEPADEVAYDPRFPSRLSLRVHNILAERGYKVIPQYPVLRRPVDLVVMGAAGKVAVHCIHSSPVPDDELGAALDHERELLRIGWKIHWVRESALAIRPAETAEELATFLHESGVEPIYAAGNSSGGHVEVGGGGGRGGHAISEEKMVVEGGADGREPPSLDRVIVRVHWEKPGGAAAFDVDACVFLLGSDGKALSEHHFVFFNNLVSPDATVRHLGRESVRGGQDELFSVELAAMPNEVRRIAFAAAIYGGEARAQSFAQLAGCSISVFGADGAAEVARYDFDSADNSDTGVVLGELVRSDDGWGFRAIGDGDGSGLPGLVRRFGIDV